MLKAYTNLYPYIDIHINIAHITYIHNSHKSRVHPYMFTMPIRLAFTLYSMLYKDCMHSLFFIITRYYSYTYHYPYDHALYILLHNNIIYSFHYNSSFTHAYQLTYIISCKHMDP